MSVRKREQQHPVGMKRCKGESEGSRKHSVVFLLCALALDCRMYYVFWKDVVPEQVEYGGKEQLIVNSNSHVARLMEGRGDWPDGGPKGATPAQEQEFS